MLMGFWFTAVQGQLPDPIPEPPSGSHFYYENLGQIVDSEGNPVPEIKFYTERSSPTLYLADDKVSFVHHKVDTNFWVNPDSARIDTSYRLDMSFVCWEPAAIRSEYMCGSLLESEPGGDYLNYYLPHCPQGITDVAGFSRVAYLDAFSCLRCGWGIFHATQFWGNIRCFLGAFHLLRRTEVVNIFRGHVCRR